MAWLPPAYQGFGPQPQMASGLLGVLGIQANPFTNWLTDHSGMLAGIGSGLLTSPSAGGGFGLAMDNAARGSQYDQQAADKRASDAEQKRSVNATRTFLKSKGLDSLAAAMDAGLPASQAWDAAMKQLNGQAADPLTTQIQARFTAGQQAGLTGADLQAYGLTGNLPGSNRSTRAGVGQPIFGRNQKTGAIEPWQSMTDGTMIDTANKDANPADYNFDPSITTQQRAAGTAFGTAQGGAQFNLPAAKQNIDTEMANIDAIANDQKGLDQMFGNVGGMSVGGVGIPNQWMPTLPNSPRAGLQARVNQVVGENFLQAYASLKGAGAITEVEGAKAQDAMARLSQAQSKDDFIKALGDLKTVLQTGYARMGQQADSGYQAPGNYSAPPLADANTTSTGVQWSVSP